MNFAAFIASRISFGSKRTFSKLIVRIAVLGIMLGLSVMIITVAIINGFKQEIREKIRGFSGDIQVLKYDLNASYENSPFTADPHFEQNARARKALISRIMPFATKPGIIKANDEIEGVVLKGVDKSYDWTFIKKILVGGRVIDFRDSTEAQKEIMISQLTADRLKLKVGDDFLMYFVQEPLRKRKFRIVGIYNIGIDEVDKIFVIGDLALIRRLNDWQPSQIGAYELRVTDFDHLDDAEGFIDTKMPVNLKSFTVVENFAAIFEWLQLLDVNTQIIIVLMLIVAIINMISALLIMILERTSMIGIMKAMGASNWRIQMIFLHNAFYLIGIGMLLGNVLGLGICFIQYQTHLFKLDQASYYMTFVPIQLNWPDVVLLNAGTLITCLLVLLIPSMLVSNISPVKAIRFK